eukprot:TRINITY_DN1212_c0_g1_i1.p1 TRINITY_DN1212_c0_g1~~TRINITY_DN1212_c0_g1_i1.p1  ORF type:complete len:170 (-),score=15.68 TRINITY_DN1212_c0_g1_i1:279-788(-)
MAEQGSLQQRFQIVDADGSGQIDSMELQKALALGEQQFSLAATAKMIRIHDRDGSGTIGFEEFVQLHKFLVNVTSAFKHYDKDNSGCLTADELFHALKDAGFKLESHAFYTLIKIFDPDRTDNLGLSEFVGMVLFMKSADAVFKAFDPENQGRVMMDYNQFVYATANCR